jgi:hypothetical protein
MIYNNLYKLSKPLFYMALDDGAMGGIHYEACVGDVPITQEFRKCRPFDEPDASELLPPQIVGFIHATQYYFRKALSICTLGYVSCEPKPQRTDTPYRSLDGRVD